MNKATAEQLYRSGMKPTVSKLIELDAENEDLKNRVAKLSKNSSNSSKSPSSDIVKKTRSARRRDKKKKRKRGGQPGHTKHERVAFSADEINNPVEHTLGECPHCNGNELILRLDIKPRTLQQVDVKDVPVEKTEHRAFAYWCPNCEQIHYASLPAEAIKTGFFKPHISAAVCFLKYVGAMSISNIKRYLKDTLDISVSRGFLIKVIKKGRKALRHCYNELLKSLPNQDIINVDESGHKEYKEKFWTWVFRTAGFALFVIDKSRGSKVLVNVLGDDFKGVIGCDYFSAYRKYMKDFNIILQFCLAHLIRDVKYLCDLPFSAPKQYGEKILNGLKELFRIIHDRDKMGKRAFLNALHKARRDILKAAKTAVPQHRAAQNMAKRFLENGEAYFKFITTPGLEPTNNIAEQAIRFIVIYRRVSQGTRSINGRKACERFWTVVATCAIQGISAFQFIKDSFKAYFEGTIPPSLIADTS